MTISLELCQTLLLSFGLALYLVSIRSKYRSQTRQAREDYEQIAAELEKATSDQVEAMRMLSAFRRQYHDGTGALVNEVHKLTRAVERLKKRLDEKKI